MRCFTIAFTVNRVQDYLISKKRNPVYDCLNYLLLNTCIANDQIDLTE